MMTAARKANRRKYRQKYKDKLKDYQRWYYYGLSKEDYINMIEAQEYKCLGCGEEKQLHVDHCHDKNNVRGLLCKECNSALGHIDDNRNTLENLKRYVEEHKDCKPPRGLGEIKILPEWRLGKSTHSSRQIKYVSAEARLVSSVGTNATQ